MPHEFKTFITPSKLPALPSHSVLPFFLLLPASLAVSRLPCSGLCQGWIRLTTSPTFFVMESAFLPHSLPGCAQQVILGLRWLAQSTAVPGRGLTAKDCQGLFEPETCRLGLGQTVLWEGLSHQHIFFPLLPPSHRPALTSPLLSQGGMLPLPQPVSPHATPWVKVRSSKTEASLQGCHVGLGEAGTGRLGSGSWIMLQMSLLTPCLAFPRQWALQDRSLLLLGREQESRGVDAVQIFSSLWSQLTKLLSDLS